MTLSTVYMYTALKLCMLKLDVKSRTMAGAELSE